MFINKHQPLLSRPLKLIFKEPVAAHMHSAKKPKGNSDEALGTPRPPVQANGPGSISSRSPAPPLPPAHEESIRRTRWAPEVAAPVDLVPNPYYYQGFYSYPYPNPYYTPYVVPGVSSWEQYSSYYAAQNFYQDYSGMQGNAMSFNSVSVNRNGVRTPQTDSRVVEDPPPYEEIGQGERKWEDMQNGLLRKQGFEFVLMSYNVLAQDLLEKHPALYRRHDPDDLPWERRWRRLLAEIERHDSDILCLQEVQDSHLNEFYVKDLHNLGYEGIFKKRTGGTADGCAIFYKTKMFRLLESTLVEFKQDDVHLLNRDNVGIIAKFAPRKKMSKHFVVATTHLLYNPRRTDVRVAQVQLFLTELDRMSYQKSLYSNYLPVILTGDFNSLPSSKVLDFINHATLNYRSLVKEKWIHFNLGVTDKCQHISIMSNRANNFEMTREQEEQQIQIRNSRKKTYGMNAVNKPDLFATGKLTHSFVFKSVYNLSGDPQEATTFQDRWVTVDYIFYSVKYEDYRRSEDKLVLLSRFTLPVKHKLRGVTIPNRDLGSDHISLIAKFKLLY